MHDQVNAKPQRNLALAFTRHAAPDGNQRVAQAVSGPCRGPVVAANNHGRHTIVKVAKRHSIGNLSARGGRFDPDIATGMTTGEILQQIECPRQNMVLRDRFKGRNIKAAGNRLQLASLRRRRAEPRQIRIAGIKQDHPA